MVLHLSYLIYWLVLLVLIVLFVKPIKKIMEMFLIKKTKAGLPLSQVLPYSNIEIINDIACFVSKQNIYSLFIEFAGYPYYADIEQGTKLTNAELLDKFIRQYSHDEPINIKIFLIREKEQNGFINKYYFEINSKNTNLITSVAHNIINILKVYDGKFLTAPEILDLQYYLVNKSSPNKQLNKNIQQININNYLADSELTLSNTLNCGELYKNRQTTYFKHFSLVLGNEVSPRIIEELLKINGSLEIICNTTILNKNLAERLVEADTNSLSLSQGVKLFQKLAKMSQKTVDENTAVTELVTNSEEGLVVLEITILISAVSIEELHYLQNLLEQKIASTPATIKEERYLSIYSFFSRLAGFKLINSTGINNVKEIIENHVISYKVVGSVVASMISMPKLPMGFTSNDWGEAPLAQFKTNYNNIYNFNLHISEKSTALAHSVVIASSGGGKTTLFEYLMQNALNNYSDLAVFSFDSFNGMTIFTDYMDGENIDFQDTALNPFQLDLESPENYKFIVNLLKMMTGLHNEEPLRRIVDALKYLPPENRTLKDQVGLAIPSSGEVYDALVDWISGTYAPYFNAPLDKLNLNNRFTNFQMNSVIKDEKLSAPVIYYIMFKIHQHCKNGSPHFIFLDEAAALIRNKIFAEEIVRMLEQHRKLRGSINLAFQSPDAFLASPYKQKIITNTANIMILGNTPIDESSSKDLEIPLNQLQDFQSLVRSSNLSNETTKWMFLKRKSGEIGEVLFLDVGLNSKLDRDLVFYTSSSDEVTRYKYLKSKYQENWKEPFKNGEVIHNTTEEANNYV